MPRFNADALVKLPHEDMAKAIKHWNRAKILETEVWKFWRRENQLPPPEDWRVWLVMAGRGFGKTRMANSRSRAFFGFDQNIGALFIICRSNVRLRYFAGAQHWVA